MSRGIDHASGFTLWELIYVMTIASIALGIGVPALRDVTLDVRRLTTVNSLIGAARRARAEAQKRDRVVVLCGSADLATCADGHAVARGWIVFENADDARPPRRSAHEPLLVANEGSVDTMIWNRAAFEFRPFPRRSTNGTITICDPRGDSRSRSIVVSYTGRPRVAAAVPGVCRGWQ